MGRLAVILIIMLSGCVTAQDLRGSAPYAQYDRSEDFIAYFSAIAFEGEYNSNSTNSLVKWVLPLRVQLMDEAAENLRKDIESILRVISDLTGIEYQLVSPSQKKRKGDFKIYVVAQKELPTKTANCSATTKFLRGKPNSIGGADIYLSENHPGHFTSCLHEEMAQAMGLMRDTEAFGRKTIFNDNWTTPDQRLTDWDKLALWVLYDPRLKPGMGRDEALPIVRQILGEL